MAIEHTYALRHSTSGATQVRRTFLALRWMLALTATALLVASRVAEPLAPPALIVITLFAASSIILTFAWERLAKLPAFEMSLTVHDTLLLSLAILVSGVAPADLILLSLLTVFLVSFGQTRVQSIVAFAVVAVLYLALSAWLAPEASLLEPAFLIRIPFLYVIALYFGFALRVGASERATQADVIRERRELRVLMEILETANSTVDLRSIMQVITSRMASVVGAQRCSVLLVDGDKTLVLAASDSPDIGRVEIDLTKYPEVRRAIELKGPVLISNVQNHPLMTEVRGVLSEAGCHAILVVPMVHGDELVGTVLVRSASSHADLTPSVVDFCQAIANVSANAVKNALLYRRVKEESARHRASVEKLQNILQNSMDLIATTDLEGRITDWNRTAEEFLGYRREEILGRHLSDIYAGAGDRTHLRAALRAKGEISDHGATLKTRDGADKRFDLTISVTRNELGEVIGAVCVGERAV